MQIERSSIRYAVKDGGFAFFFLKLNLAGEEARLDKAGVQIIPDICWCSITEPIFPTSASVVMTNSGKYSHYAKGLTGRDIRFGSLQDCASVSCSGVANSGLPEWLLQHTDQA